MARSVEMGVDRFSDMELETPSPERVRDALFDISGTITHFEQQATEAQSKPKLRKRVSEIKSAVVKKILPLVPLLFAAFQEASEAAKPSMKYVERDAARVELARDGITKAQSRRYIPGVSEVLYRGIEPWGYEDGYRRKLRQFVPQVIQGRSKQTDTFKYSDYARNDAWRLYLGMPQEHNTFGISDFQPSVRTEDKYYFKTNDFLKNYYFYSHLSADQTRDKAQYPERWEEVACVDLLHKVLEDKTRGSANKEKIAQGVGIKIHTNDKAGEYCYG